MITTFFATILPYHSCFSGVFPILQAELRFILDLDDEVELGHPVEPRPVCTKQDTDPRLLVPSTSKDMGKYQSHSEVFLHVLNKNFVKIYPFIVASAIVFKLHENLLKLEVVNVEGIHTDQFSKIN